MLKLPSLLAFSGLSLSISTDCAVGSEYLEREPAKLYPSCTTMHAYRPFSLGYQDASPSLGIPLQRGFRHVSYSHYHGGSLVSCILTSFWVLPYPICSYFLYIVSIQGNHLVCPLCSRPVDLVWCVPLGVHTCRQVQSCVDRMAWTMSYVFQSCGLTGSGNLGKKKYRHISVKPGNTNRMAFLC